VTWKRALLYGLVFGVSGLAYAAYQGREERERERRKRLVLRRCDGEGCEYPFCSEHGVRLEGD